ncbi:MAG: cysteine--tRNA ligase [Endomicrobium sp.]|uniref:cysteine--tRNA ligase n=1 Tax=Candidatus Endomicrobiellum cubanum TaxID=3242325 RepID=UPI0028268829|nr:cysteine--tRNA ligase [Endomicrobium sp.]MDR2395311.1 cysteine--tRNA ligase [Endomicrobium sp.]
MAIKIWNTLTNTKEYFKPQKEGFVSMYVCGVTPYDQVHLGHARAYVVFDIIKRHFLQRGYKVTHIQNFTDVDDKIIKRASEKSIQPSQLAQMYIDDYFSQMDKLNVLKAQEYPRVTSMITDIINFIKELVAKGFAYNVDGDVYFPVEKFKNYGKLSKRKLDNLKIGARVNVCDEKVSAYDFALWKKTKKNEPEEVSWDSPWSKGRPGWHIECSVMSSHFLGDTIDIHGGGQDLIFPHHENEIAQSEAKTGRQFVKYWIHNGFVTVNKEKMSKSLNNFFTLETIFEKYNPRIVRYYLLTQHYSSPLDFSDINLNSAKNALQGLDDAYLRLTSNISEEILELKDKDLIELKEKFLLSLDDDFNSEKALSYLHELKSIILNELFSSNKERLASFKKMFEDFSEKSLGIVLPKEESSNDYLQNLFIERNQARKNKNWQESDRLRDILNAKGYKIIDNKDGTSILVKKI